MKPRSKLTRLIGAVVLVAVATIAACGDSGIGAKIDEATQAQAAGQATGMREITPSGSRPADAVRLHGAVTSVRGRTLTVELVPAENVNVRPDGRFDASLARGLTLLTRNAHKTPVKVKSDTGTRFLRGGEQQRAAARAGLEDEIVADGPTGVELTWKDLRRVPATLEQLLRRPVDDVSLPARAEP